MEAWKNELTIEEKTKILKKVIQICHANLFSNDDDRVLKYLGSRGIKNTTARLFELGAFPSNPSALLKFVSKNELYKCGILSLDKEAKRTVCKFSTHEMIIPIYDVYGDPIALMGRCLVYGQKQIDAGIPKYINTFYKKGKSLFGLNQNKDSIRLKSKAFVVEGNFDVITAYQNGMRNVVASCGTFLTKTQLSLLARYTKDIRLLFDNDDSGREASSKILKKYTYDTVGIKKAKLPLDVKDLDEFFVKRNVGR